MPADVARPMLDNLARGHLFARRLLGNAERAEDAVQEACLRYLRGAAAERGERERAAYFMCQVRGAAEDLRRGETARRRREEVHAMESERGAAAAPADRAVEGELARAARRGLEKLPPETRSALCLCCEEDFTRREAARILEVPETTVEK